MITFKLGKDKSTGKIVAIEEVTRGRACGCICPECEKDLVAAQGEKNDWHFRHNHETTCKGGQETALHMLAKEIIASNIEITLPIHGTVSYDNCVKEKYFQTIQPDVTANSNGQNLFFEVFVTHKTDKEKENFYIDGEHKSVEIDLHKYAFATRADLEKEILINCDNKRIIFWEKKVVAEKSNYDSWIMILFLGLLALFGLNLLFQKRK